MKYSIVIPAHNEEHRIGKCLDSIRHAEMPPDSELEVIVVLNRCTDGTERIARDFGATVVRDDTKNLAHIRNSGAAVATGDILVTIDADSWMSENMIIKVTRALESGKYIGGGVEIFPERCSVGIHATIALLKVLLFFTGLTGGLYWCYRKDFEEMGGFNEDLYIGEDLDFARRLRKYGKSTGRKLKKLTTSHITTSCRKFDKFGDWHFLKMALFHWHAGIKDLRGKDHSLSNKYFYDFEENNNGKT